MTSLKRSMLFLYHVKCVGIRISCLSFQFDILNTVTHSYGVSTSCFSKGFPLPSIVSSKVPTVFSIYSYKVSRFAITIIYDLAYSYRAFLAKA